MRQDLVTKAIARLGSLDVREAFIPAGPKESEVYGLWETAAESGTGRPRITINPSWHVVTTLIHEALHEIHPTWSERSVKGRTTRIIKALTPEQIWALYEEYKKRVQPCSPSSKRR